LCPAIEEGTLALHLLGPGICGDECWERRQGQHERGKPPLQPHHDRDCDREKNDGRHDVEQDQRYRTGEPLDAAVKLGHDGADAFAPLNPERHPVQLADRRLQ
jgi:hypothetical protein